MVNDWETKSSFLPYGCSCWKAIINYLVDFKQGIKFEVVSVSKTRFLLDRRCSLKPLMLEHPTIYRLARNKEVMVEDYWVSVGDGSIRNVDLRGGLNDWEVDKMANLLGKVDPIHLRGEVNHCLCWIFFKDRVFSIKSCRRAW